MTESTRALKMTSGRSQYLADGGTQYVVDAVGVVWGLPLERIDDLATLKGFEVVDLPPGAEPLPPLPAPRRGVPVPASSVAPVPATRPAPQNLSLQEALAPIAPGARLEGVGRGLLQQTLKAKGYDVPPDVVNEAVLETWARLVATERNFEKIQAVERSRKAGGKPEAPVGTPVPAGPAPAPVPVTEALKDAAAGGPEPTPSPAAVATQAPPTGPGTPHPAPPVTPPAPEADEEADGGTAAWIAERSAELAAKPWAELKDDFRIATGRGVMHDTKADVIKAIATAQAREAGLLPQE